MEKKKKADIEENNSSVNVHINNKTHYLGLLKHAALTKLCQFGDSQTEVFKVP